MAFWRDQGYQGQDEELNITARKVLLLYLHRDVFDAIMRLRSGTCAWLLTEASKKLVRSSCHLSSARKHANISFRSSPTTSSAHNPCRLHRLGGSMPSDK